MRSTPWVERCRCAAKRLHHALNSVDVGRALEAASRFRRLRTYRDSTPEDVLRRRSEIKLKHALAVIAEENGYTSWHSLLGSADRAPSPGAEWPPHSEHDRFLHLNRAAFFEVRNRLDLLQTGDVELDDALMEAVREVVGSSQDVEAQARRFRAMERWIGRYDHLLRTAGLIGESHGASVPCGELIDVLWSAPFTGSTAGQSSEASFDLYRTTSDALLRRLGWSGPLPTRGTGRSGLLRSCDLLPIPGDAHVAAETWCYATPGDATALRIPWEVAEPLLCGWRVDVDPAWRSPDGSIQFMGVVVLRVNGAVRFIERASAAVTRFPVLVFGPAGNRGRSTLDQDCRAVMEAVLAEAGSGVEDAAVLTHLLSDLRAMAFPIRLEGWFANTITEQEHAVLAEAALAPDRSRFLWDLAAGRIVAPGIPLRSARY